MCEYIYIYMCVHMCMHTCIHKCILDLGTFVLDLICILPLDVRLFCFGSHFWFSRQTETVLYINCRSCPSSANQSRAQHVPNGGKRNCWLIQVLRSRSCFYAWSVISNCGARTILFNCLSARRERARTTPRRSGGMFFLS